MASCCITDRVQDITVLDDVVEILGRGNYTGRPPIISPETIPVRDFLPFILPGVMGVDVVPIHLRKSVCGFVEFFEIVENIGFTLNRASPSQPHKERTTE